MGARSLAGGIRAALGFLTRLPAGRGAPEPADLARSVVHFPLVGALLGGLLAGSAWVLAPLLAPAVLAVVLVAELAILTGGLHLDGLADTVDGLSGGRGDRERILRIMRDGATGPHGAAAVALVLLGKVAALAAAVPGRDLVLVAAFPVVARAILVPLVTLLPYARPEGLGTPFRGSGRVVPLCGALLWIAAAVALAGPRGAAGVLIAALGAAALAIRARRAIGGLTGDVYGAAVELAEALFLMAAVGS